MSNRPPLAHRDPIKDTAVLADADFYATDITPARGGALRVTVAIKAGAADSVLNARLGGLSAGLGSAALTNGKLNTFVFTIEPTTAINFQMATATTLAYFHCEEVQAGVL